MMKPLINIAHALFILALSNIAYAQSESTEADAQKWYQIELLVFANNNLRDANEESWSMELGLKYPQRIVKLIRSASNDELLSKNAVNDPFAKADQILIDKNAQLVTIDPAINALTTNPLDQQLQDSVLEPNPQEQAFTLLEQDQLQLTDIAKRIFSQADFRPLFHGAWRQPVSNRRESESILIQGGDPFDNHFELEGSVKISVERYLHLQTDLWLSQFSSNVGQQQIPWPILPSPPFSLDEQTSTNSTANVNKFSGEQEAAAFSSSLGFDNPFRDLVGNQYSVEKTYALRQNRRMRSKELHYVDHPLMGLLIKITPYELPQNAEDSLSETTPTASE